MSQSYAVVIPRKTTQPDGKGWRNEISGWNNIGPGWLSPKSTA
jgi:hypothetical protein